MRGAPLSTDGFIHDQIGVKPVLRARGSGDLVPTGLAELKTSAGEELPERFRQLLPLQKLNCRVHIRGDLDIRHHIAANRQLKRGTPAVLV